MVETTSSPPLRLLSTSLHFSVPIPAPPPPPLPPPPPPRLQVTLLSVRGRWADSELQAGLELALGGCGQLRASMRECLLAALAEPRMPA